MKHIYSISASPGNTGERYYNHVFKKMGLEYHYRALQIKQITPDIVTLLREMSVGFSVSMPLKSQIIPYLDDMSDEVFDYGSCNTVLMMGDQMCGFNTDIYGIKHVLTDVGSDCVAILGDGAMSKMFQRILGRQATVYSRSNSNWEERHSKHDVIINCTPLGMNNDTPLDKIQSSIVIDLVIGKTQLETQCMEAGVKYIPGIEFYREQFLKQFLLYTGIVISKEDIKEL